MSVSRGRKEQNEACNAKQKYLNFKSKGKLTPVPRMTLAAIMPKKNEAVTRGQLLCDSMRGVCSNQIQGDKD